MYTVDSDPTLRAAGINVCTVTQHFFTDLSQKLRLKEFQLVDICFKIPAALQFFLLMKKIKSSNLLIQYYSMVWRNNNSTEKNLNLYVQAVKGETIIFLSNIM